MGHTGASTWGGRERLLLPALLVVVLGAALLLLFAPVGRVPAAKPPLPKVIAPGSGVGPGTGMKYSAVLSVAAGNVSDAIAVVREEHARTRAERDAFEEFRQRVESTPANRESRVLDARHAAASSAVTAARSDETGGLPQVRRAYEETVMDVDHYEDEYDETLAESVAEEFGPELGSLLVSGRSFTPLVKEQLLGVARKSRHERGAFLETLEEELEALEDARGTLERIGDRVERETAQLPSEQSLGELISADGDLEDAREECTTLLEERQQQRVDGHAAIDYHRASIPDLHTYLYQSLAVTYPVLADATELLGRIERTRRQLSRELAARF